MPGNWPCCGGRPDLAFCDKNVAKNVASNKQIERSTLNPTIRQAISTCEAFVTSAEDSLALPREAAEFVHAIVLASKAVRGLEIGTGYGYSGLWIGAALSANSGSLVTIDRDRRKIDKAQAYFADAGLSGTVSCKMGAAAEVIDDLNGPFDFVFVDAEKGNCRRYVEKLSQVLSESAVIITDNTTTHRDVLSSYCQWLRDEAGFTSLHIPIGNGMELSVKC